MTTQEVRTLINEAKNIDWFNARNLRFYNTKSQFDITLKGFAAIYEYTVQQSNGWEAKGDNLPQQLKNYRGKIQTLKVQLQSFIKAHHTNAELNYLNSQWNNQIESSFNSEYVPYTLSEVDFLIVLNESYPSYFQGAYSFLLVNGNFPDQLNNQNNFMGTMMAYEFKTKDSSEILARKNAEAQSVINTKKDFEKYLSSSELSINEMLEAFKAQKKHSDDLDLELFAKKTATFEQWENTSKESFEKLLNESTTNISQLEESYSEKLKLEAPSHYWQIRSEKLKAEGKTYMNWMIGMIVLGVILLFVLLVCTPKDLLESFFGDNKLSAVRWSIVFVVFISLIVAGIRMLSKLMFSSFHLSRDAEERQQLTHVYLALIKDAKIDKEERQLIMQSLFSRADTGLLKEDSAPTMPSGIEKLIR